MYQRIGWPITQADFKAMELSSGCVYVHAFGDRGAVFRVISTIGALDQRHPWAGRTIVVTDNGGEVNVHGLGFDAELPSIPMHGPDGSETCGPATAGYRIYCKITGAEVDYRFDLDRVLAE